MPKKQREYYVKNGRRHWRTVIRPQSGVLKGRRYLSETGYRRALDKAMSQEAQYKEDYQHFILQKGPEQARKNRGTFNDLYRRSREQRRKGIKEGPADQAKDMFRQSPQAVFLDYIGVRPLSEFGMFAVDDTPDYMRKKKR